jgi:hypothetical protein
VLPSLSRGQGRRPDHQPALGPDDPGRLRERRSGRDDVVDQHYGAADQFARTPTTHSVGTCQVGRPRAVTERGLVGQVTEWP